MDYELALEYRHQAMPDIGWMVGRRARMTFAAASSAAWSSFLRLREVFRVRRQLPDCGGHQIPVPAHQIVFLADGDIGGTFQARLPAPGWIFLGAMPVCLV